MNYLPFVSGCKLRQIGYALVTKHEIGVQNWEKRPFMIVVLSDLTLSLEGAGAAKQNCRDKWSTVRGLNIANARAKIDLARDWVTIIMAPVDGSHPEYLDRADEYFERRFKELMGANNGRD